MDYYSIKLRFNHNAQNEFTRWRLLVDNVEHIVSEVIFENVICVTTKDEIEVDGVKQDKWHVSALAEKVEFQHGGEGFIRAVITNG